MWGVLGADAILPDRIAVVLNPHSQFSRQEIFVTTPSD